VRSIEQLLARLTAQSIGSDPKQISGGKPELTTADISLIAAQAPHMSYHALMSKCGADPHSTETLIYWLHNTSLTELFLNPAHDRDSIIIGQLNRLITLTWISWAIPYADEAKTIASRAAYIRAGHDSFTRKYQAHYNFLTSELDYLEVVGRMAIKGFNQPDA